MKYLVSAACAACPRDRGGGVADQRSGFGWRVFGFLIEPVRMSSSLAAGFFFVATTSLVSVVAGTATGGLAPAERACAVATSAASTVAAIMPGKSLPVASAFRLIRKD